MKKAFGSPQTPSISTLSRRPKITRPLRKQLATPIQNGDRFIANRSSIDFDWARYLVNKSNIIGNKASMEEYDREPTASLVMDSSKMSRILSFSRKPSGQGLQSIYSEAPSVDTRVRTSRSQSRYIPQHAGRTVNAPDLVDDNHLNLLDWSDSNILSIALGNAVYLWEANTRTTSELLTVDNDVGPIGSVNWAPDGKHIAIGLTSSAVQIWDSTCNRQKVAGRRTSGVYGISTEKSSAVFDIYGLFLLFGVLNEEYYRTDITFMGIIKRRLGIGSSPPDCRSR
ncbi:cell division cycle 20.2, cofactor of APC complex isoform X1 [Cryptomeria japonica]|uniref:cell division cycle 20.2, cofactor of APC complex isoform X1 n=1 Tax=Cryptomeria japonica TaxID=3369 RepID=UPI0027DA73B2|nr:cell division cycle 20.2, cofactor of APC complex isoform X1 [Cryptomeria japonica]XP_057873153.2 cell division cycle 20.2, cofactor of APC complex isoform X1 [Cryptomeria japonica]